MSTVNEITKLQNPATAAVRSIVLSKHIGRHLGAAQTPEACKPTCAAWRMASL